MRFISRSEWGARYAKGNTAIGSTLGVTLHWTGPAVGIRSHADCAEKVRSIERFHAVERGWAGVAYNLLVCPHGYVYEGRGAGVRSAANGDTASNDAWYAVCYLGGEGEAFTAEGATGMVDAVAYLRREGNAGPRVNGHRDHKGTECPGAAIYRWLRNTDFDAAVASTTSEEDDMPTAEEIAHAVWTRFIPMGPNRENPPAQAVLRQTFNAAVAAKVDTDALAAAIVKALPAGKVDQAVVEAGVKKALADLVNGED